MTHAALNLIPIGSRLTILVDNTTVVATTSKSRSANFNINSHIRRLLDNYDVAGIEYIPSSLNPADGMSRGQQHLRPNDWQLLVEALIGGQLDMAGRGGKQSQPTVPKTVTASTNPQTVLN